MAALTLAGSPSWGAADAETRVSKIHLEVVHAASATGCPSEAEVTGAVVSSLGYDPFVPLDQADRILSASFELSSGTLTTTLALRTPEGRVLGEQRLAYGGGDCREAAAAAELAIAMAVDPPGLIDSGFAPAPPTPAPQAAAPDAGAAPTTAEDRPAFEASIGTLVAYGSSPRVTAGFTAGAGLRWTHTSLDLEVRADLPTGIPVPGGSVQSTLIFGALAPCLRSGSFGGCGLFGGGINQASGQGLAPSLHGSSPYFALGARGFADLELSRALRLQPRLDLWAPLTRTTLTANGDPVWVTPPLSVALGLALLVEWQ